jgi:uncharacterized protein (DUF433 family)
MGSRITHHPDPCGGRPCIRGMRIRVPDTLELKAASSRPPAQGSQLKAASSRQPAQCRQLHTPRQSSEQILTDSPDLEAEDLGAALAYAAREIDYPAVVA